MNDPVHHADTCPAPRNAEGRGRLGDLMIKCRNCGRFALLEECEPRKVKRAPVTGPVDLLQLAAIASRLRVPVWSWDSARGDLVRIA